MNIKKTSSNITPKGESKQLGNKKFVLPFLILPTHHLEQELHPQSSLVPLLEN